MTSSTLASAIESAPSSAVAVHHGDEVLTYGDLRRRALERAAELGEGRRLVLLDARVELDFVISYVAVLMAGHVGLVSSPANVDRLTETWRPDTVVSGAQVDVRSVSPAHELHPDLSLLMCTSGSTGDAKVVRLSHRNLDANARSIAEYLSLTSADCAALLLPLHYCYGLSVLNSHLVAGAALSITGLSVLDECFWDRFEAVGATSLAGVPHTFDLLERSSFATRSLPTLRYVTQAGGRLPVDKVTAMAETAERRGFEFFVMYGQTEATARMAYLPPALVRQHPDAVGVAVTGGYFHLQPLDDDDSRRELVYRGPNVMMGYGRTPADLRRGAEVDELRTGDLAEIDADGVVRITGRRSRFVKPFGLRVDLDALEHRLADAGHPVVCTGNDSLVVVATDRPCGEGCVAETVRTVTGLPAGAVRVVGFEAVPRLPNGKPDYRAIEQAGRDGHPCNRLAAMTKAHDDTSARLILAYAAATGRATVDRSQSFVALGGDSMSYVELASVVEAEIGHLPAGWHTLPISALAAQRRQPGRLRRVETNVVLRALAIVLVVANHATLTTLTGGAHALLAVAGFNFARFWLRADGQRPRVLRRLGRIAAPAIAWVAVQAWLRPEYGISNVLMVNNYWTLGWRSYWFVEVLLQTLLLMALLFAVPAVRRWERRHPFTFASSLLAVAMASRFGLRGATGNVLDVHATHIVLFVFILGWMAQRASSTPQRALVIVSATVSTFTFFNEPSRALVVSAAVALLVLVPNIALPRLAARLISAMAAASLFTYLTHYLLVYPNVLPGHPVVTALGCLALGALVWRAYGSVAERLAPAVGRFRRLPAGPGGPDSGRMAVREKASAAV